MEKIENILLRFLQQKLSPEELKELNEWSQDPENHQKLIQYLKIWIWSAQLKNRSPQVEFSDTWQKIINNRPTEIPKTRKLNVIFRYAATILILISIGWWGNQFFTGKKVISEIREYTIAANNNSNSVITFPDKTVAYLRQGSSLRYDPEFTSGERKVYLEGEAYFEVSHDEDHPFIVSTANAQIRDLGTRFDVSAEKGSDLTQTTLVEGKVEFETNAGKKYVLQPNEMIAFNAKTNDAQLKKVDPELYIAWKDGKIIFRDETLGEITDKLEKFYDVKFKYENTDIADKYRFTGTFYAKTPINEVITMLKISIPMHVSLKQAFPAPDTIIIK